MIAAGAVAIVAGFGIHNHATTFQSAGFDTFPEVCPIHKVDTIVETVPNHGVVLAEFSKEVMQQKADLFPLAQRAETGSGHPNPRYKRIERKYCPACRVAFEEWSKKRLENLQDNRAQSE